MYTHIGFEVFKQPNMATVQIAVLNTFTITIVVAVVVTA